MNTPQKSALVVSAHSADFVWRAGGAIALHAEQGYAMHVVCLSFGERGESAKLWRKGEMTEAKVKDARREEAMAAAEILGASVEFFDIGDYPMRADKDTLFRLADVYRRVQPEFVLSHSLKDPYNYDHPLAMHLAQEARIIAQAEATSRARRSWAHRRCTPLSRTSPNSVNAPGHLPGHHLGVGQKVCRHPVHGRPGTPLGVLHPRGPAARRAGQAQRGHRQCTQHRLRRRLQSVFPRVTENLA